MTFLPHTYTFFLILSMRAEYFKRHPGTFNRLCKVSKTELPQGVVDLVLLAIIDGSLPVGRVQKRFSC